MRMRKRWNDVTQCPAIEQCVLSQALKRDYVRVKKRIQRAYASVSGQFLHDVPMHAFLGRVEAVAKDRFKAVDFGSACSFRERMACSVERDRLAASVTSRRWAKLIRCGKRQCLIGHTQCGNRVSISRNYSFGVQFGWAINGKAVVRSRRSCAWSVIAQHLIATLPFCGVSCPHHERMTRPRNFLSFALQQRSAIFEPSDTVAL
jgi:hypothetical protein